MRDLQWSSIVKYQDELVKAQQQRKRQRQAYHKILYKNQLQRMIEQKNQSLKQTKAKERSTYKNVYSSLDHTGQNISKESKNKQLVKQFSDYNRQTYKIRNGRLKSQLDDQKYTFKEKYRKAETQLSEQRQKYSLQKVIKSKELAQQYEQQINKQQSRKYLQKLENRKFQQLAKQIEEKKEEERAHHINRIKYGYNQNPQTYDKLKSIYSKQQQMKEVFLKKLELPKNRQIFQRDTQINKDPSFFTIQTSNYNKNSFTQRNSLKRQRTKKETEQQNNKLLLIQKQVAQERIKSLQRKQETQSQLKKQLQEQMREFRSFKGRLSQMNDNQRRINKSYLNLVQPPSIPGLYKDYKDIKKEEIIDNFLRNQKYSIQIRTSPFD